MKKLIITLGQDLSAYATLEVPAETDLSDENLAAIARKAVEDEGTVFDEDWSTVNALRIVLVQDEKGQTIRSDVPVESSCHEGGAALQLYLRGAIGIEALVNSAIEAKLIDSAGGGAVKIRLSGKNALLAVHIDPAAAGDAEMLEDLVKAAHDDARKKLDDAQNDEMKGLSGGLGILPGFKMPF